MMQTREETGTEVTAEHAARRAAHDVEHVERNTNADVAHGAARQGEGRLSIRQEMSYCQILVTGGDRGSL